MADSALSDAISTPYARLGKWRKGDSLAVIAKYVFVVPGGIVVSVVEIPSFRTDNLCVSEVLRHTFSNLTNIAVATLDDGRSGVTVGTLPATPGPRPYSEIVMQRPSHPGKPISFASIPLTQGDLDRLEAYAGEDGETGKWNAFLCRFESGRIDRIAVRLAPDADEVRLLGFLSLIWPVLRDDCLQEIADTRTGIADEAMLWLISKKMDVAVFVMNDRGEMLRSNAAAKIVLDQGLVLKRSRRGIVCSDDTQTRMLREAIASCAAADPGHSDAVMFLAPGSAEGAPAGARIPVALSRFFHEGAPTGLVTMTLPSPPDSRRVEILAREMGLTQAEARVAALMQLGLSNREAARIAGLTEQSLCTYAKRVLNKLNVTSRAEVAQMLTWQAQGGPVA